jgi:protein ImuB
VTQQISLTLSPRVACVDVPAIALQLVLRAHESWVQEPVVVVTDDRPRAPIVWANRAARQVAIHRGMSFSEAKALSSVLHAEVVPEHVVLAAIDAIFEQLLLLCPHIEPALDQPGLFWLDPNGLGSMFGDLERWARAIREVLRAERYVSSIAVGFARGHVLSIARIREGVFIARDPEQERSLSARVLLSKLEIPTSLRDELALLGIHTVGELLALPGSQLRVRYGAAAARLHDFLSGKCWTPLLPREPTVPLVLELEVEPPDDDHGRLLFGLKSLLHRAGQELSSAHQAITALEIELVLERDPSHHERIETAAPTLDVMQILELVRLRFSSLSLPSRTEHMRVTVEHVRVHPRQVALYAKLTETGKRARDLEAAGRALARLRASFGPSSVAYARVRGAHLPEARFTLVPVESVKLPQACTPSDAAQRSRPFVKRVYSTAMPLPALDSPRGARDDAEAWLGAHGAATAMHGPDRIAGGWWASPVERDYYVVETNTGELLWVYHDRLRRRWMLHGVLD